MHNYFLLVSKYTNKSPERRKLRVGRSAYIQPDTTTVNEFKDIKTADNFRRSGGCLADKPAVSTKVKGFVKIEHFLTFLLYE